MRGIVRIKDLSRVYTLKNMFMFEGRLYERLFDHPKRLKYRFVITDDDYDYVVNRNLRRRLDMATKGLIG